MRIFINEYKSSFSKIEDVLNQFADWEVEDSQYYLENFAKINIFKKFVYNGVAGRLVYHVCRITCFNYNKSDIFNYNMNVLKKLIISRWNAEADLGILYSCHATLLDVVAKWQIPELVSFLIQIGADINHQDCDGHTPLYNTQNTNELFPNTKEKVIEILLNNGANSV